MKIKTWCGQTLDLHAYHIKLARLIQVVFSFDISLTFTWKLSLRAFRDMSWAVHNAKSCLLCENSNMIYNSEEQWSAIDFTVFPEVRFQVQTHLYQWSGCIIYKIVSGLLHKQLGPHSLNVLNRRKNGKILPLAFLALAGWKLLQKMVQITIFQIRFIFQKSSQRGNLNVKNLIYLECISILRTHCMLGLISNIKN